MTLNPRDSQPRFIRKGKILLLVTIGCFLSVSAAGALVRSRSRGRVARVLCAEFERQEGMLLAWPNEQDWPNETDRVDQRKRDAEQQVLINVIAAMHDRVATSCLVPDTQTQALVRAKLKKANVPPDAIEFIEAPVNSMWVRDYGPIFARGNDGSLQILDTKYVRKHHWSDRLDAIPTQLGRGLGIPIHQVRVEIDGGEILSNGAGLCLVAERNEAPEGRRRSEMIKRQLGAKQVVFLQPLFSEATGHVDMFATFTSTDTIVIGEYSKEFDETNSLILDQNAARLRRVRTSRGPLKVVRIPMPPRVPGHYSTYTNVVYVNGRLLFPSFSNADPKIETQAIEVYRKLLPGWEIVPIDATPIIKFEGSLHCLTATFNSGNKNPSP